MKKNYKIYLKKDNDFQIWISNLNLKNYANHKMSFETEYLWSLQRFSIAIAFENISYEITQFILHNEKYKFADSNFTL